MNRQNSHSLSFRRWVIVFSGLIAVVFGSHYFSNVSAQTDAVAKPSEQTIENARLAFSVGTYGPGTPARWIYTANGNGTGAALLPISVLGPNEPAWSPDGTKIAFTSNQTPRDIFVINVDGSGEANLTNTATPVESNPSWSVTGKIAYERDFEIWTMNADGSGQAKFSAITRPSASPTWSPNGRSMAFVSGSEIWVINADGTNERQVTNNGTNDSDPAWSPDGTKIVFGKTGSGISVINADGTNETPVPTGTAFDRTPSWSPDGTRLAVRRPNAPNKGIVTVNVIGGGEIGIWADQIFFPLCCDRVPENPAWQQPARAPLPASFDFDGDKRSDVSVYRPADGMWHQLRSTVGYVYQPWGVASDVITPVDYDGDMRTDLAIWRESEGKFYILNSSNSTFRIENFGSPGDIPVGGDWDGDGKGDVAVYRDAVQAVIQYRGSLANPQGTVTSIDWGTTGDKPILGDFDGDGRTDPAVFRPSSGIWYVRRSSDGQWAATNFGVTTDVPVPADYDGDGKTDIAVYRDGVWYLLRSAQGYTSFYFGIANDVPAPADYDGDGRADATIYRNGVWWILKSQSGAAESLPFGLGSDKPIPSAFVR